MNAFILAHLLRLFDVRARSFSESAVSFTPVSVVIILVSDELFGMVYLTDCVWRGMQQAERGKYRTLPFSLCMVFLSLASVDISRGCIECAGCILP